MINMGVVGYGYWGPNLVRNFAEADGAKVTVVSDMRPERLNAALKRYPLLKTTTDYRDVLKDPAVDAVAIATPVFSHYGLAMAALRAGKHVLVEKPMTASSEQAMRLIEEADRRGLRLMVDHTFAYTGAVRKIRELIAEGSVGDIYYYDSVRVNLGLFQHDINVLWDLAPHDLSIMDYLIKGRPEAIVATGQAHLNGHEDIAFMTLYFPDKVIAHINVNWLSPVKVRTTRIGGEKRLLIWNDLEADEKVKVYDKGVEITSQEGVYNLLVNYRSGDMYAPQVKSVEALREELTYFIDCVANGQDPMNDGNAGMRVVKMLEAASESMSKKGSLVYL
jgi:predicted dehydrogenase